MGREHLGHPDPVGLVRRPTRIGPYSFIGPYSVIAPGAQLGKGVLVKAHSFVSGPVPDFAIVGSVGLGQAATVVGDTRELDAPWLARHPAAQPLYAAWAGAENLRKALDRAQAIALAARAGGGGP